MLLTNNESVVCISSFQCIFALQTIKGNYHYVSHRLRARFINESNIQYLWIYLFVIISYAIESDIHIKKLKYLLFSLFPIHSDTQKSIFHRSFISYVCKYGILQIQINANKQEIRLPTNGDCFMFEQSSHHSQLDLIAHVSSCLFWASVIPQHDLKESDATPELVICLTIAHCLLLDQVTDGVTNAEGNEVVVYSKKQVIAERVTFLWCRKQNNEIFYGLRFVMETEDNTPSNVCLHIKDFQRF